MSNCRNNILSQPVRTQPNLVHDHHLNHYQQQFKWLWVNVSTSLRVSNHQVDLTGKPDQVYLIPDEHTHTLTSRPDKFG
jgi:hypothetical protein